MRKLLFIPALVLALSALVASPAHAASTAVVGGGVWSSNTSETFLHTDRAGLLYFSMTGTVSLQGTLTATCNLEYQVVVNPSQSVLTYTGTDHCVGSVAVPRHTWFGSWYDIVSNSVRIVNNSPVMIRNSMVVIGTGGALTGMHGQLWLFPPSLNYRTTLYMP